MFACGLLVLVVGVLVCVLFLVFPSSSPPPPSASAINKLSLFGFGFCKCFVLQSDFLLVVCFLYVLPHCGLFYGWKVCMHAFVCLTVCQSVCWWWLHLSVWFYFVCLILCVPPQQPPKTTNISKKKSKMQRNNQTNALNFRHLSKQTHEQQKLAKKCSDFCPLISRKIGCKKFHEKSSANSTSHEVKFFHHETLGAWGTKSFVCLYW